jgi:hypothetical protein
MAIITGIFNDPFGMPLLDVVIQLTARKTTSVSISGTNAAAVTATDGSYVMSVMPGVYAVSATINNAPDYLGIIQVYADSPDGTLNQYLAEFNPDDATPESLREMQLLLLEAKLAAASAMESAKTAAEYAFTLKVGTVSTLEPGEDATVEITGDAPNQTINFGIPQGNDGAVGFPRVGDPGSTALMQIINGENSAGAGSRVSGSKLSYVGLLPDGSVFMSGIQVAGTWEVWGVLASTEQSPTTVTLMARTDGTTLLTPTAMLESARMSANVRNCQYSYPGITAALDCEILVNGQWHPFTAMVSDHTSYGPIIYRNAKAGMYGEIKPYQKTE